MRTKKILIGTIFIFLGCFVLFSCNNKKAGGVKDNKEVSADSSSVVAPTRVSFYNPIEGYFTTLQPTKNLELVLDSTQFEKDFQYAATMTNHTPAKINFANESVGAIVLPETNYETNIQLLVGKVVNDTLYITYSIEKGDVAQSYTTIPVQLFAFNKKFKLVFDCKEK